MASCGELSELPDLVAAKAGVCLDGSDIEAVDEHLRMARPGAVPDGVEDLYRAIHDRVTLLRVELPAPAASVRVPRTPARRW